MFLRGPLLRGRLRIPTMLELRVCLAHPSPPCPSRRGLATCVLYVFLDVRVCCRRVLYTRFAWQEWVSLGGSTRADSYLLEGWIFSPCKGDFPNSSTRDISLCEFLLLCVKQPYMLRLNWTRSVWVVVYSFLRNGICLLSILRCILSRFSKTIKQTSG